MPESFDIDFEVPFRHRVRFTENLAEENTDVLLELFESPADIKPRVLIVVDDHLLEHSGRVAELVSKLETNQNILLLDGGSTENPGPAFCLPCLLYTSPSPRDRQKSRMPSSA